MPGVDVFLDGADLCRKSDILAGKSIEAEPCSSWNAIVLLVSNDLEQLRRAVATLGRYDAELSHVPADRIRQHRSLTNQKLSAAMQHQDRLLLFRFGRHKTHRRPRHRLADGRRIVGVVLAAFEIGFHIAWWHQPNRVAERRKLTAPMMCGRTRLNTDQTGRQSCKKLQYLGAAHTLADHHCACGIDPVNLEYRLRNIETNRANLAHGRLPSTWFASAQPPFGTLMPQSGRRPQHH